jgi:uncharacterized protein (DUF58 family)
MPGEGGGAPLVFPSKRFSFLFALGCVLSLIKGVLLYYNAVILAVLAVDFLVSHSHPFSVERQFDTVLSIGAENPVWIVIENRSAHPLKVQVRDEYPVEFSTSHKELQWTIPAYETGRIRYTVTPFKRGEYTFGKVFARRNSFLGLWVFEYTFNLDTQTKVYPNVQMVKKYDLLSRRQMLNLLGVKPTRMYGQGTEFEMLRDYQPDDEYRAIDWKATSKKGIPISRVYQVERTRNIMLMIDAGRVMGVQVGDLTKLEHAVNSALLVSFVALRFGERVGLCIFSSDIKEYIPLQNNKTHFNMIVEALYNLKPDAYESDYKKAFEYIAWKNRKRSLVVVYTDLIERQISEGLIQYCSALQKTHLPLCVAVKDINITNIAASFPATEQGLYQKAVALKLLKDRQIAIKELNRRGVRVVDELPEKLTISTLNKYLELKSTMRV